MTKLRGVPHGPPNSGGIEPSETITDAALNATSTFERDAAGHVTTRDRLTRSRNDYAGRTRIDNAQSYPPSFTDESGRSRQYRNGSNRGHTTGFAYDSRDNVEVQGPGGRVATYARHELPW